MFTAALRRRSNGANEFTPAIPSLVWQVQSPRESEVATSEEGHEANHQEVEDRRQKGDHVGQPQASIGRRTDASRSVRAYLDALDQHRPKRGRKLDPESVRKRIAVIDEQVKQAGGFERLNLLADKAALEGKLAGSATKVDLAALRRDFVKHAKTYGDRKNISYGTWRAAGVSADDLKAAGIRRTKG